MSSRNPFRTPVATPQHTGLASTPSSQELSAQEHPAYDSATLNNHTDAVPEDLPPLPDEPPPAYSSAPDFRQGETSVDFGPRRPFQPPPSTLVHPPPFRPSNTGGSSTQYRPPPGPPPRLSPQPTGLSDYPGSAYRQNTNAVRPSPSLRHSPPPQHPTTRRRVSDPNVAAASSSSHSPSSAAPTTPLSDFARDFYAAGAGPANVASESDSQQSRPSRQPHQPRYAPPPGPPPSSSGSYAPPPGRPPSHSKRTNDVPDDGKPTRTPVPGHPLLRDGKLLVYPNGYECHKCHNTGYKNFDPSHPCSKCWDRYAKPYSGAITYTPWSPSSASTSTSNKAFQRPLPSFSPPHLNPPAPSPHLRPPPSPSSPRPRSYPGPPARPGPGFTTTYARSPPPGSTIVQPGDPRIGGQLCWRCHGRGTVPLILFIEDNCDICGGLGRVFT